MKKIKYIVKINDKYASSPLSKLTNNKEFAGVVYTKEEAEEAVKYHGCGEIIELI